MSALRLALIAALALAACARKGDPEAPESLRNVEERPRLVAPSEVTDPIRRPKL